MSSKDTEYIVVSSYKVWHLSAKKSVSNLREGSSVDSLLTLNQDNYRPKNLKGILASTVGKLLSW